MHNTQHTSPRRDRGNILPLTMIMMVVGTLIVMALLTFAMTLLRNRPPLEERSDSLEAVRSAMRMAIVMQRDHGPGGCYEAAVPSFDINNRTVAMACQSLASENDNGGRFGLIATSNNGLGNGARPDNEAIKIGTGNVQKEFLGSVFINGGQLGGENASVKLVDGELLGSTYSTSPATSAHRYTAIDPATDVTQPLGITCSSLFGPAAQQIDVSGPLYADSTPPISTTNIPIGLGFGIRVNPASGATILGVLVGDGAGTWKLDRSESNTSGRFDVEIHPTALADPVRICFQNVPATDPTYIPVGLTYCNSPLIDPELFDQNVGDGIICTVDPWWTYAGWKPDLLPDYVYPMLPQIPSYTRSATPVRVGTTNCYVFYPGRYQDPIVLGGGNQYYFASGIYLLRNSLTVSGGAKVVAGEGAFKGCAFDADAAFLQGSPQYHEITGKGATFLLSGNAGAGTNGTISVTNSSFRVNSRVATNSTRASSGVSVMSINMATTATGPADVEIPFNDRVLLPGCLGSEVAANPSCAEDIATYSVTPVSSPISYEKSGLGPNDTIISAQLDGTSGRDTNRVLFAGNVFVPNARIVMATNRTDDAYRVSLANGAVASSFDFDFAVGNDDAFVVGQETETVYEKLKLVATTNFNGQDFRSVVELEVDSANRYAINNWTVDSGSASLTPPTPTTTTAPAPTTTTTLPPGPTTTVVGPTTTTTTSTTTTTTTTTTTVPSGPCAADPTWTGQYWTNKTLSGAPALTRQDASINFPWGSGAPVGTGNGFSARWTRKIAVAQDGNYHVTVGGDDGYRLWVNGVLVVNRWFDQSYAFTEVDVPLVASCANTFVMEFYENTGQAEAHLILDPTPVPISCGNTYGTTFDGNYYNGTNFNNYKFDRDEAPIDFDWGNGSPNQSKLGNNTYSIRWDRTLNLDQPGTYRFTAGGNDGYRLTVNGTEVINNWSDHGWEMSTADVVITNPCDVVLKYEYYENSGSSRVYLDWVKL